MYVFSFFESCGLQWAAVSNRFDRFDFCLPIRALYHLTPRIKLPAVHVHRGRFDQVYFVKMWACAFKHGLKYNFILSSQHAYTLI